MVITDTDRIDWLEKGHGIVGLINSKKELVYSVNFSQQDWTEHATVRAAIDEQLILEMLDVELGPRNSELKDNV